MSTIKSPQEKKRLSLELDRRNTYGENDKSSRKNIPLAKAKSHRDSRRTVGQKLAEALHHPTVEATDTADANVLSTARKKKVGAFKKWPDGPLGGSVAKKLAQRKAEAIKSN